MKKSWLIAFDSHKKAVAQEIIKVGGKSQGVEIEIKTATLILRGPLKASFRNFQKIYPTFSKIRKRDVK